MKKKITIATKEGLIRLKAVEAYQSGKTLVEVGEQFKVHYSSVGKWVKTYERDGVERLNTYMKPRPSYRLDAAELEATIAVCDEIYKKRLTRILRLAKGEKLSDVAISENLSPQIIMRDRKKFLEGKLPPTMIL